jgi:transposase
MQEYIAFDSHNWYWITVEIEQAGWQSEVDDGAHQQDRQAGHPRDEPPAAQQHAADGVDSAPGPLRELRELTRTRVVLVAQRTRWKNRITATLAKWGLPASEYSDPYEKSAREELGKRLEQLPEQTRWATRQMLAQLDSLSEQIRQFEKRVEELVEVTPEMQRLDTLPGVGVILAATIALEIGEIGRFLSAERLASYSGTTPRVHASGDRTRFGRTRPDVNRYLKWAFAEAANSVAVNYRRCPERHVSQLYARLRTERPRQGGGPGGAPSGRGGLPRAEPAAGISRSDSSRGSDQRGVSATLS